MKLVSQLTPETISQNAYILPWNHAAARPCQIQNLLMLESFGGTNPVVLLKSQPHLAALKMSNLWFLLTDGEITSRDVRALATTLAEKSMHGVPCVIVIFDNKSNPPSNCNISVGISPFAAVPNSALLYQDITVGGKCHVLATKGCFNAFLPAGTEQPILDASTSWDSLPTIYPESAFRGLIIPAARELAPGELALSDDLTINFNNLFETDLDNGQVNQLLGNQNHLQSLLLSAHSRGQSASALSWLQRHTATPQPSRVNNRLSTLDPAAATSIRRITDALQNRQSIVSPELSALQRELRASHRRNSQIPQDYDSRTNIINSAIDSLQQASRANWASSSLSTARQSPAPPSPGSPAPYLLPKLIALPPAVANVLFASSPTASLLSSSNAHKAMSQRQRRKTPPSPSHSPPAPTPNTTSSLPGWYAKPVASTSSPHAKLPSAKPQPLPSRSCPGPETQHCGAMP